MIKRVYGARDYEGRFASWPRVPSKRRPLGPALWMETMFLVAGLAVAGLVGIAAAFYFSIRSGNRGGKRLRSTRPGLSRPDLNGHPRRTADDGRPVTTFRPAASPKPRRAEADTGPDPVLDFDAAWPDDPMPGDPSATDPRLIPVALEAGETRPIAKTAAAREAKPRRRKGFRKGADLDEELWPAESFGGVSDEQFWDDLASDKPLASTARTAHQEPPSRNRLSGPAPGAGLITGPAGDPAPGLDTGPATGPQAVQAPAGDRKRDERGSGGGRRGRYPSPRAVSDPTAERTAIQPSYAATQPVQAMKPPLPGATQPVRVAASSSQPMNAAGRPGTTQPREAVHSAARDPCPAARGRHPADRDAPTAAEQRRGRPADQRGLLAAAERSGRRPVVPPGPERLSGPLRRRHLAVPVLDAFLRRPVFVGYPDHEHAAVRPELRQRKRESGGPAAEPRRRSGNGGHARPEDPGDDIKPARQANPRGSHQATGSYRSNGSYPANGYPGNGYQARLSRQRLSGQRAPRQRAPGTLRPARRLPAVNAPALT